MADLYYIFGCMAATINKGVFVSTAFGCTEPERQFGVVFTRNRPDVLTVTCNASGFEYQLHCAGNDWIGQQYNCSNMGKH